MHRRCLHVRPCLHSGLSQPSSIHGIGSHAVADQALLVDCVGQGRCLAADTIYQCMHAMLGLPTLLHRGQMCWDMLMVTAVACLSFEPIEIQLIGQLAGSPVLSMTASVASKVALSSRNSKGRCSLLTRCTVSVVRPPISTFPKFSPGRSKATRGSETLPTRRNRTSSLCSGMLKRQNDSCTSQKLLS